MDELAEAMSRRCVRFFGPSNNPILDVGYQGRVEVDCASRIRISTLDDYKPTVGPTTWEAVNHYASELKKRNIKIAFFSATPQGGGVALMRHALVRYARELGVDLQWYVSFHSLKDISEYTKSLGMFPNHVRACSASQRQTTTFCKACQLQKSGSPKTIKKLSKIGCTTMLADTGCLHVDPCRTHQKEEPI